MNNKYTKEDIEIIKKYYPIGDWDTLFKHFPNSNKVAIKGYANKHGIYRKIDNQLSYQDITGKKYNMLTAISFDHKKNNTVFWKCKCDCGNVTVVDIYALVKGTTKSCGCLRHKMAVNAKDFTGMKFGLLTAVERLSKYKKGETYYRCNCECGKTDVIVKSGNLRSGHTISCGTHNHKRIEYKVIKDQLDDNKNNYSVYRHIAPNGKSYIGITKQDPERRFQNGYGYKTQPAFWRAINKYGWENFKHKVLETGLTEKKASEKEQYYINDVYHSLVPRGYNTSEGGTTGSKNMKPVIQYYKNNPVNFFESISDATKLLNIAQKTIRDHNKGNPIYDYYFEQLPSINSYNIPLEYYELVNESHYNLKEVVADYSSNITINRNISLANKINKYSLDGKYICTYSHYDQIRKDLNRKNIEGIRAAVNPNRQGDAAYGFMWRYDAGDHANIKPIQYKYKLSVQQIDINTNSIINEFPSIAAASRFMKCGINSISKACKCNTIFKGYKWKVKN